MKGTGLSMTYYIDDRLQQLELATALADISEQRRQQALLIKHEQGQRESVAAYLLLRRALHETFGLCGNPVFEYGEHGKPRLADQPGIHFSLSHCRLAVACAVSTRPVGIDIERVRPFNASLARYAMDDDEMAQLMQAERPDVAFIRLWTMKEAALKLTGTGIAGHLKTVLKEADWRFTTVTDAAQHYVCTVCEEND